MGKLREILKAVPGLQPTVQHARLARARAIKRARMLAGDPHARRLSELRDTHAGRRAFIVGNGPSLNLLDLSRLAGEITFCVNAFYLMYDRIDWRPTYYVVEDTFVAEDNADVLNAMTDTQKLIGRHLTYVLEADAAICYDLVRGNYPGYPRFSDRCDVELFEGGTVTYVNIQLASWMGCDPIYLIGMDMSYDVPDHMADGAITSREADLNHFHPDYFGPGKRWHDPQVARMRSSIRHAGEHLSRRGVRLLNATRGGRLEELPRVDYDELFDRPRSAAG